MRQAGKHQFGNKRTSKAEKITKQIKHAKSPFNWLRYMDENSARMPQALAWGQWGSHFFLQRYPNTHPEKPAEGSPDLAEHERVEAQFRETLATWERHIEERTTEVIEGLNAENRLQLAALARDCYVDIKTWTMVISPRLKELSKVKQEGKRRLRMARKKIEAIYAKLQDLRKYVKGLDEAYGFKDLPAAVNLCLIGLEKYRSHESFVDKYCSLGPSEGREKSFSDPTTDSMVHLYWFFRHGCDLTGGEAEVRVAKIRNAFWIELGISPVEYTDSYKNAEHKGCTAVRQAVMRY
jgi:hypothetical protein